MQGGKGLGGHPVPPLLPSRRLYGVSGCLGEGWTWQWFWWREGKAPWAGVWARREGNCVWVIPLPSESQAWTPGPGILVSRHEQVRTEEKP